MRTQVVKRIVIAVVVLLVAYAACGFLLAPWLLQRYVPPWLQDRLGREVTVGEFRANPFLLTVEARDVAVAGDPAQGGPMLAAQRLFADASLPGLLRGTVALDDLRLEGLRAHLVLRPDGTFNVADVAQHWSRAAGPSTGEPPKVALDQLSVPDARIVFTDRSGREPAEVTLAPVDLHAQNLSTAGGGQGTHELTARLPGGGELAWQGELALKPALQASGSFELHGLRADVVWPFLREHLALSGLQAALDASGRYAYAAGGALQLSALALDASGVGVVRAGAQAPLLQAQRIAVSGGTADLGKRSLHLGELVVADGGATIERAQDGSLNWAALAAGKGQGAPAPAPSTTAPPATWTVDVPGLRVQKMDLAFTDHSGAQPLAVRAEALSAQANLSLALGAKAGVVATGVQAQARGLAVRAPAAQLADLQLGAMRLEDGRFDLDARKVAAGTVRLEGGQATVLAAAAPTANGPRGSAAGGGDGAQPWTVSLGRLELAGLGGRVVPAGNRPPLLAVGAIDGSVQIDLALGGARPQVVARALDARVKDVALAMPGDTPPMRLASGQVAGGHLDLAARQVGAGKVVLSGTATLVLGPDGQPVLPSLLARSDAAPARAPRAGRKDEAGWQYAVDQVQVPSLQVTLLDRGLQPALRVAGTVQGSARNVASDKPVAFDVALALAQGGKLTASGSATPGTATAQAKVQANGIALRPFQPLLERIAALEVRSGALSGSFDVSYGSGKQPGLRARGNAGVADLVLVEAGSGDRFLSWKKMDVQGATLDLGTRRLVVREVTVVGPDAKVVVSEDRSVNLAQVFHRGKAASPATAAPGGDRPGFRVAVNRVLLRGGAVDFTDQSLVLPFATTVKSLDGTIVDISSEPAHRAGVQASGSIEPYGSASIDGSIVPSNPALFTDLQVRFSNVQVPPLSPYTATFAGRKVQSGKLWLDLDYHVEDGAVLGKNAIRLSNFTLGERVNAPNALDVPLDLVVALLTDADGDIRLTVPVTGEVGDAKFSVASAVRQALGNVLRKVVSAPFRALASLFGGSDTESLAAIDFLPGSAQLRPEQVEKLDALTRALRERPQLQLVVSAPYDPKQDAQVLQREQARQALAKALGEPSGPQAQAAPIAFDDPATRRALERLLGEQAGDAAVQQVRDRFTQKGQRRELYEAMFERLVAAQQLTDGATRVLAADRARGIASYLQRQGVDRSRVQTGSLATEPAGKDGEVTARLEVAAAADAAR